MTVRRGPGRDREQVGSDRASHRGTPAVEYTRRPAPAGADRVSVAYWGRYNMTPEDVDAMTDSEFDVWIHRDRDQDPPHEVEKVPAAPRRSRIVRDQAESPDSDAQLAAVRQRLQRPEPKGRTS